jgi:uroporphyrinogen-III synthase
VRHTAAPSPSAPLAGWRVLIARPAGRADDLVSLVRAAGGSPLHVPLIATTPVTSAPLRAALDALADGGFSWVALTSAAAVSALQAVARAADRPLRIAPSTRIAAVGAATAAALRGAGLPVHLLPETGGSAAILAAAWPVEPPGSRVLVPCSDRATPTLADALRATGHDVTTVVAYRTEILPVPEPLARDLADGRIDVVLLTSPSTVQALAGTVIAPGTGLVAIGQPTAHAARAAGRALAAVAAEPSAQGLVDALIGLRGVAAGARDNLADMRGAATTFTVEMEQP